MPKINVRMPPSMHSLLAAEAARHGMSINALVVATLAGSLGWTPSEIEQAAAVNGLDGVELRTEAERLIARMPSRALKDLVATYG